MCKWYEELEKKGKVYLEEECYLLSNVMEVIDKKNKGFIISMELYLSIDNSRSILIDVGSLRAIYEKKPLSIVCSYVDLVRKSINGSYLIYIHA